MKYRVLVTEHIEYVFQVEASDIEQAKELGLEEWQTRSPADREMRWMVDGYITEIEVEEE
tara:strand:- start:513 stop:692 length:180 start_codon:yes stop_codon:yes gene_type:complete